MAILPGDIVSHAKMCMEEGVSLQKGMNFRVKGRSSVILMSLRKGAPYADYVEDNGNTLIYEGHDVPKNLAINPKQVDQVELTPNGKLTENGKFLKAVRDFKNGLSSVELVKVYEKIKDGIWVYNGLFELIDAWKVPSEGRIVFKFKLRITDKTVEEKELKEIEELDHNRMIPTEVKLAVWKRDKGRCVKCGSNTNLHFDHILPYAKGGTSLLEANIQLLCAKHNLRKRDNIV